MGPGISWEPEETMHHRVLAPALLGVAVLLHKTMVLALPALCLATFLRAGGGRTGILRAARLGLGAAVVSIGAYALAIGQIVATTPSPLAQAATDLLLGAVEEGRLLLADVDSGFGVVVAGREEDWALLAFKVSEIWGKGLE